MDQVWSDLRDYWRNHPLTAANRYGQLDLSMFTDPSSPMASFPKLKGKAAEVKSLVPALAHVFTLYKDESDILHDYIEAGLNASKQIDEILTMNRTSVALRGDSLMQYRANIFLFLLMQNSLGLYYPEHGYKLFDVTPKSHFLAHSAWQAEFLNPVLTWCFSGEDFMRKIKDVAGNSVHGTPMYKVGNSVTDAYCQGMHLLMTESNFWVR